MKPFARQLAIVFGLWTLIGICNGLAEYAFQLLMGGTPSIAQVFRRPLTEQWIWAALTPLVFMLAGRVPPCEASRSAGVPPIPVPWPPCPAVPPLAPPPAPPEPPVPWPLLASAPASLP